MKLRLNYVRFRQTCQEKMEIFEKNICRFFAILELTEQEGFEPPIPFGITVFKTVALSRSATAPSISVQQTAYSV